MTYIPAIGFVAALCFGCSPAADDNRATEKTVVAEETLMVAKQHGLDYVATLAKAKAGDSQAVRTLIDFSEHVDAASALGHGVELVDLAVVLTDRRFAVLVQDTPQLQRRRLARLFEAGFAYHLRYSHGDFSKVLPSTYAALDAR